MGHIGKKLLAQALHLGKLRRRVIQGLGQFADLFGASGRKVYLIISPCQLLGGLVDRRHRPGNASGDEIGQKPAQKHHNAGHADQLHLQGLHCGVYRGDLAFNEDHSVPTRGRPHDLRIQDHLRAGPVLIGKGRGVGGKLPAALKIHLIENRPQIAAGHAFQQAFPLGGLPGAVLGAQLVRDQNIDAQIIGKLFDPGIQVAVFQLSLDQLRRAFYLRRFDRLVKGSQKGDLKYPQQHRDHQNEHAEAQSDLPADLQRPTRGLFRRVKLRRIRRFHQVTSKRYPTPRRVTINLL